VNIRGHAIEARLCAEDPSEEFRPQTGTAHDIWGDIRIDSAGDVISVSGDYDSMLAKLIASAPTRPEAIAKLVKQLQVLLPSGIRTNRNFLLDILNSSEFQTGSCTIDWLSRKGIPVETQCSFPHAYAAAIFLDHGAGKQWRSNSIPRSLIMLKERTAITKLVVENFRCNGYEMHRVKSLGDDVVSASMNAPDGTSHSVVARFSGNQVHVVIDGRDALFEDITYAPAERKDAAGAGAIRAPMAGKIIKLATTPGATVAKGDLLVVLEAMKMEHELRAATDGTIDTISIKPGDQVAMRQLLISVKPA
jgi:geranyl-CoA carboxylase alpha subunit